MLHTTEVRWWWPGGVPPGIDTWFAGLRDAVRDEVRSDHYLLTASGRDLGIKARSGESLDIKTLADRTPGVTIVDGIVGTVEQWQKWSFALAPDDLGLADLRHGAWVRTRKSRWLIGTANTEVELVAVELAGQRWWSLAVEAEGTGPDGRERLVALVRRLAAAGIPDGLELSDDRSYGYAELLTRRDDPA